MKLSIKHGMFLGADLRLPAWAGYQSRHGPYGSIDSPLPSNGSVSFIFAPERRELAPLNAQEFALTRWFEIHEPAVSESVKRAIVDWCAPDNKKRIEQFDFGDEFPVIAAEADLKRLIGLHTINMHQITSSGLPYLGFEFGCDWEEEHGLGVLMHGNECVEVGFDDTARLLWIAEVHAEKRQASVGGP